MSESLLHHAMAQIQALLAGETGAPLHGPAVERLEDILRRLTAQPRPGGSGFEVREVTVLLADLRGFTTLTAHHSIEVTLGLLNQYLARMTEVIVRRGGAIDKFMGDAIMVVFGAPDAHPDDAMQAVTCAVEMQIAMGEINARQRDAGMSEVFMGIGINTGRVMAGLLGSDLFSEYTVIGEAVNLASRIESLSLRGQVLIGDATLASCAGRVHTGPPMAVQVKGSPHPLRVHEVLEIGSPPLSVPRREVRHSPRVRVGIAARYRELQGKRVGATPHEAVIVDIGCAGLLLELQAPLPALADIMLDFELPGPVHAKDVCAKVRRVQHLHGRTFAGVEFTSMDATLERDLRNEVQALLQARRLPVALGGADPPER